jgi:acetyltransferase-like isoleucine patch superfamily enzyme
MLIQILKKIRKRFRKDPFVTYNAYVTKEPSTVLLPGSDILFNKSTKLEDRPYVSIGAKGLIGAKFIFESEKGNVRIGNNVHLGNVTFVSRNSIVIEDDVTMAWDIMLYDHNSHSAYWEERKSDNDNCYKDYFNHNGNNVVTKDWSNVKDAPIRIGAKVWVGFGVTILKGVTVGEGAVIGAKSVVVKDVEPWTVVAGNPAQIVKYLPEYKNA